MQDHSAPSTSKNTVVVLIIIVAVLSLALGVWLSQHTAPQSHLRSGVPQDLDATVLPNGKPLKPFELEDYDKKPFGIAQLRGKWSFLFFGYTHCPDVCPLTLSVLNGVAEHLAKTPADAANTQFVFVSVDPDRDKPADLKKYVHYFNAGFLGVTGQAKQIDNLTGQLGVLYGFQDDPKSKDGYTVNHSAQILLIDPQGRERAVFSPPHEVNTITDAFRKIRHYYEG